MRAPRAGAASEVVCARASASGVRCVERTAWGPCARVACAPATGESDALGAAAVAVAASRVATGKAAEVLVLGADRDHGYAILLAAP